MMRSIYSSALLVAVLSLLLLLTGFGPFTSAPESDESEQRVSPGSPVLNPVTVTPVFYRYPPPQPPGRVKEISVAEHQVCVLTHGGLATCWAIEPDEYLDIPRNLLATISAGTRHFCALDVASRIFCWGEESANQLDAPEDIFIGIAAGESHSCALDSSGSPICWGTLDGAHRNPPSGPYAEITAAGDKTCASGAWETSRCWGVNAPSRPFREPITTLTMSTDIICALDLSNRPICHFDASTASFEPPSPLAADLAVGRSFVCTLDPAGGIVCEGPNAPALPESPPISRLIDASENTLCAVTAWEEVMCWNQDGEIGEQN